MLALVLASANVLAQTNLHGELRTRVDHYASRDDNQGGALTGRLEGRTDLFGGVLAGQAELSRQWMDGHAHQTSVLRELSWTWRDERWRVSLGRLMIVRGRADGFRVLDILVPVDSPDQFHEDAEHARVGAWGSEIEYDTGNGELGLWLSADRHLDRFRPPGDDLPHRPRKASGEGMSPLSVALRWSGRADAAEYTVMAYHGLWRQPLPAQVLDAGWNAARVVMLGASFDVPVGALVLRGEAARMAYDLKGADLGLPQARALIGLDWLRGSLMLSPQVFAERNDRGDGAGPRWRYSASMLAETRLMQDRLHLRYFGIVEGEGGGRWHSAQIGWLMRNNQQWRVRVDHFDGDRTAGLGLFFKRSRASVEWVIPFSVLGP
ncbi:hypothetical protein [Denitromonas iodatirespirans]|uniref:Uncharacterized protein n=1 Tax=Denitromonas iodatirespirans TaxID=2795389 RepID=A0A944H9F9_DENI1|nr:hypothetical protein [Denitromonas iodatirespirans]MBT0962410.1 hypothetical protein [Denitromonas iodatirespirans]